MNKLFTQLIESRHITDDFLYPKYENLTSPNLLPDIQKAVTRIKQAIKKSEHILIYGDYDVDGVTASTLMEEALKLAGVQPNHITIMLPDRFADGYGMSPKIIKKAKDTNTTLVITVDCGSNNHDIIKELNSQHIDTIVTDHHECQETLPEAIAIINPKRKDHSVTETLKNLAGVGVAFKLAEALKEANLISNGQEKWLLDLVLIGTICDNMLVTGENRVLCYYGTKVLAKTRRKGLRELMRTSGVRPNSITSEAIGFQIGPRLNAAGRLETAELSLKLLRTDSSTEAATLTAKLEELNKSRRTEQRTATGEIITRLSSTEDKPTVIIETGAWHEGILGIVAGRLVETYHQPAFVLTELPGDILKGSGRSFGDFSLAEALTQAKDIIISGGGHAAAAGVKLYQKDFANFCTKIREYYASLGLKNQDQYFIAHPDLIIENAKDFTYDLLDDLKLLEPYGAGNEEPIFAIKNASILSAKHMGDQGQHLRLDIKSKDGKIIKCVAFSAPEKWFNLYDDENYTFIIKPTENNWNGVRSIEARLLDIMTN